MLRINLLPPYVFDKQKKVKWVAGWVFAVLAVICGFLYWNNQVVHAQEEAQDEQAKANAFLADKKKYDDQTAAVNARIATTKQKQDFIAAAQNWNDEWWKLYSAMRDVTSPKVILRKMYLGSPTMVNIVGWAPSEKEAADWWIDFRNKYTGADSPFSNVSFELPKNAWPPNADNANTPGAPGSRAGAQASLSNTGGFGATGAGSPGLSGGGANDKDEEPGPGYLEDRLGIYFRVHVTLKTPFDGGKTAPVWGAPDTSAGAAAPGAMALPGGAPRGGPPPGASSGGSPASSGDDSGGGGSKKSKRGGGGEE